MTKGKRCGKIERNEQGALAQLGAHNTGSVGVRGSNPLRSTKKGPARYAARVLFWWFCFHGSNPLRHRKTESACNHVRCFRMRGKTEKWRNECAVELRKNCSAWTAHFGSESPEATLRRAGPFLVVLLSRFDPPPPQKNRDCVQPCSMFFDAWENREMAE